LWRIKVINDWRSQ